MANSSTRKCNYLINGSLFPTVAMEMDILDPSARGVSSLNTF